ncbi:MAG: dipeptide epimerase [Chloroflexi bacterium]|nr:MAG: dipeptide epimerase [Chloroflexota bacterium]
MNATVRTVELHLAVPFEISRATYTTKRVVLVELREGDRVSRGEGVPDAFFGETAESVEQAIRDGLALLPDDPLDLATLDMRLAIQFPHGGAACCAIDILAHDRAAQAAGVPLRELLGLVPGEPPATSFTVGIDEPELMAGRAANAAVMGFAILKVKLGRGDDVSVLAAIRERFSGTIRVDPNAAWSVEEAPKRISRLVPYGIEFVEQPIAPDDIEGLRAVHARSELPIVVDEAVVGVGDVAIVAGACEGINVKLQKCGGVAAARAMIAEAHDRGLKVMLGCRAAETSVGIAAAANLAPAVEWCDLDGNLLITDDPFRAVAVKQGRFVYPRRPGLGAVPA